jgi:hypothetical protein
MGEDKLSKRDILIIGRQLPVKIKVKIFLQMVQDQIHQNDILKNTTTESNMLKMIRQSERFNPFYKCKMKFSG